jgi:ribosomal protein S12 methylthiotransferase accessory factor
MDACPIETTDQMLSWMVDAIEGAGLSEIIVVDLTQADIGVPVVHVTVPGLEANVRKPLYTPGARMQRFLGELGLL